MSRQQNTLKMSATGFTLLELVVTLTLMTVLMAFTLPSSVRWVSDQRLLLTQQQILWDLRIAQQQSQTGPALWTIQLYPYTPEYGVYDGTSFVRRIHFQPEVNYVDGYLQITSGRITYNSLGESSIGGVVRLTTDGMERDITLYLNSGLQIRGSVP